MTAPEPNTSAVPSSAPTSGGNGVGSQDPRLELARMLAQRDAPAPDEPQASPPPAAQAGPETSPEPPPAEEAPGQENFEAEQTPPAEGETPAEGATENPSDPTPDPELTQALAGLSPTERASALELVKQLSPGEIPRINKLISQRNEAEKSAEELRARLTELETRLETGAPVPVTSLPETIARLKTPADFANAQRLHKELKRWCERNPQGGTFSAPHLGVQALDVPADSVLNMQDYADDVLTEHLPARQAQLNRQTQFSQARQAARSQALKEYPVLNDPDNADTKLAQQFLKHPGLAGEVNAEYVALALARGHRELQAEKAARNGNGHAKPPFGNGKVPVRAVTPGKVPTGKPSAPAGGASPKVVTGPDVAQAIEAHRQSGSRDALAAVLASSGR